MKKGFTLIELMVYVALLGVIIVVAGRVYSDSTKFRLRTQNMLKATEEANRAASLIQEDLSSMGSKSWKVLGAGIDSFYVETSVYLDPDNATEANKDSSSYVLTRSGDGKDSIVFRRVEYHANGSFSSVQQIAWFLRGKTLWRSCQTLKGAATTVCPNDAAPPRVIMAENVETFSLTPGAPGVGPDTLFPSSAGAGFRLIKRVGGNFVDAILDPETPGGTSINFSGLAHNYDNVTDAPDSLNNVANEIYVGTKTGNTGSWGNLCYEFTFLPKTPYLIKMNIPYLKNNITMFRPGHDHMAIGLRKKTGATILSVPDYVLYPSFSSTSKPERSIEMMFADTIKACLAFTIALYSPLLEKSSITIEDFTVLHLSNRSYQFGTNPSDNVTDLAQKKNVKAFKLQLKVINRGESGEVESLIPVLNNGEKANPTPAS
jgi:prepilin-type N-terminal cleavage/methylation domain-containing protein